MALHTMNRRILFVSLLVVLSGCEKQNNAINEIEISKSKSQSNIIIKNISTYQIIKATFLCEYVPDGFPAADAFAPAADAVAPDTNSKDSSAIKYSTAISYTLEPGSFRIAKADGVDCHHVEVKGARYIEDKYLD